MNIKFKNKREKNKGKNPRKNQENKKFENPKKTNIKKSTQNEKDKNKILKRYKKLYILLDSGAQGCHRSIDDASKEAKQQANIPRVAHL
jgi:hypothetical protein